MKKGTNFYIKLPVCMLYDDRISKSAMIVYAAIVDKANPTDEAAQLTLEELAKLTGLSTRTVRRAEAQLDEAGYIYVQRTGRASIIALRSATEMIVQRYSTLDLYAKEQEAGA